jgi:ATP-dependent Clp protease ATP-binding subunit ClpA
VIFNRFTKVARRCVEHAVEEARFLGHDSVGSEDLLLGLLAADDGIAGEALRSLGVSLEAARNEAEQLFADALTNIGISLDDVRRYAGEGFAVRNYATGRLPFSPHAKKTLEQALRQALRLHSKEITGEHILLGILRNERGPAVRILANLGVSTKTLEERLDQLRR